MDRRADGDRLGVKTAGPPDSHAVELGKLTITAVSPNRGPAPALVARR
jgi:hypothetical protein